MGRRTEAVKQGESSSSSSTVQNSGESSNPRGQVEASQESSVKETCIDDLPSEMLMKILKFVDTSSLFHCRLVSRRLKEISDEVLCNRPEPKIVFSPGKRSSTAEDKQKTLSKFVTCIRKSKSKNSPYTTFWFEVCSSQSLSKFFNRKDWKDFLIHFDVSKIKCLHFLVHSVRDVNSVILFTEKLSDLLLNKITHLEEFSFGLRGLRDFNGAHDVRLFPPTPNTNAAPIQLPQLKVIRFEGLMASLYRGILEDLLNAAVNLKEIDVKPGEFGFYNYIEIYELLYSLGKFHHLQYFETVGADQFFTTIKSFTNLPPVIQLKELNLRTNFIFNDPSSWTDVTSFISYILESCKDSLKTLKMEPLEFLPGLRFPTFKNLKNLYLCQWNNNNRGSWCPFFPPGIRSLEIFPAVDELTVKISDWGIAFPGEDYIPRLPSMGTFSLNSSTFETQNLIPVLALLCPNLKNLRGHRHPHSHHSNAISQQKFLQVGREIWTLMKQLESLDMDVDVNSPDNSLAAFESCFTGISIENCHRLDKLMDAKKTFQEHGIPVKIPKSAWRAKIEHPSILDMQSLKKLTINPYDRWNKRDTEKFWKSLWISQLFAFESRPHLKPKRRLHTNW